MNIDHHHDNSRFGDVNLIVAEASSTGEILRDVIRELGVALTPAIAEALYIAIVTDTGRFQYSNTTAHSLRLAAELVDAGADVHRVFQGVYESVAFAKLKLVARALETAQLYEDGRVVVSHLEREDFQASGAAEPFSEGIIDYLRAVEGVELAALIRAAAERARPEPAHQPAHDRGGSRRLGDRAEERRRRPSPGGRLPVGRVGRGDHRLHPPRVPRPSGREPRLIFVTSPGGPRLALPPLRAYPRNSRV